MKSTAQAAQRAMDRRFWPIPKLTRIQAQTVEFSSELTDKRDQWHEPLSHNQREYTCQHKFCFAVALYRSSRVN